MRTEGRPEPVIPDHEVLRRIGGGAYGEVWLARGVTGALRAVKVVWREDFEDERGFEREFEGILKFEPISRDHPGLMNILHVGRSPVEPAFYYCVMELGDDVRNGREINPIDYEPRTLRGDIRAGGGKALAVRDCIEVGLCLAEGLEHLHQRGLAHRDIKPSNVIFVAGNAKLADIGLVAARGQRTFVGTEGFVPPEGPGSARADVYSLGKVLYECATGKDRLEFPDPPDELPEGGELKLWQALNRVICEVCEPHASRRRLQSSGELAEALRALKKGRKPQFGSGVGSWLTLLGVGAVLLFGGWEALQRSPWGSWVSPSPSGPVEDDDAPKIGKVRITSYPEGAEVYDENGIRIGTTPTAPLPFEVGSRINFTVRKDGFRTFFILNAEVGPEAVHETLVMGQEMEVYAPPVEGQPWTDHVGMRYQPDNSYHVSSALVPVEVWMQFTEAGDWEGQVGKLKRTESGEEVTVVAVDAAAAASFSEWLADEGMRLGYLTEDFQVRAEIDESVDTSKLPQEQRRAGLKPFRTVVEPIRYATLVVTTQPAGAEVYIDGVPEGFTGGPLEIGRIKPGTIEVQLVLEGYRTKEFQLELGSNQRIERSERLEPNQSVVMTRPWENGLGMRFVPVGKDLMACVWETRVKDYDAYVSNSETESLMKPAFPQEDDHPVVYVSREEAATFCEWLTLWERKAERIALSHEYRLPTDLEWSLLVGLHEDPEATPAGRSAGAFPEFPWGSDWPPGPVTGPVGNLADETALRMPGVGPDMVIAGYDDGIAATSPVGSFPANALGLFDLSGNVKEWVSSNYTLRGELGVLRGGGWNTFEEENLYSGSRNTAPPWVADKIYGFRVMLARVPAEPAPDPGVDPLTGDEEKDPAEGDEPVSDNTTTDD